MLINAPGRRWQEEAAGGGLMDEVHPRRRVGSALHDIRFDGFSDLLLRADSCSVFDVGCNRGHVLYDFAMHGARAVHGCDIDAQSMMAARVWFAELPHVKSQFEVVNLEEGPEAVKKAFQDQSYDMVLLLGVTHKLKRVMSPEALSKLVTYLSSLALTYFAWHGYMEDVEQIDRDAIGFTHIHMSELAKLGQPAVIWKRL